MPTKIFVNLPVKDLNKSVSFFTSLGFLFNQQFTDETAACMIIADNIYAMLLIHEKFQEFTTKQIVDAHKSTEVLTCIAFEMKENVDILVDTALEYGATETTPAKDFGFMYNRSFNDLDGHIWEIIWMEPASIKNNSNS